jgi:hypothetical protein
MLATLYDLEIVEEKGVRDWLSPPDNRHLFLKEAKGDFTTKENVEAKKQVCVDAELATEFVMRGRVVLVLALPMPYMLGLDILLSPALLHVAAFVPIIFVRFRSCPICVLSDFSNPDVLSKTVLVSGGFVTSLNPCWFYLTSLTPCWFQAAMFIEWLDKEEE